MTHIYRSRTHLVMPDVDLHPGAVPVPEITGRFLATTSEAEREELFQPTKQDNEALLYRPAFDPRHQAAVANVERAVAELRELKDRKTGYCKYRNTED